MDKPVMIRVSCPMGLWFYVRFIITALPFPIIFIFAFAVITKATKLHGAIVDIGGMIVAIVGILIGGFVFSKVEEWLYERAIKKLEAEGYVRSGTGFPI